MIYIVVGVIVLLLLYIILTYLFSDRKIIKSSVLESENITEENKTVKDDIPKKPGITDFTISFWIYIERYGSALGKSGYSIINKDYTGGDFSESNNLFEISADNNKNDLVFKLNTLKSKSLQERLRLENVLLQKWLNVIMTVETRNLDIYLDGKLEETIVLDSIPNENINEEQCKFMFFKNIEPNDKIVMKISNIQYLTRKVAPREAWSIYKEGYKNVGLLGFLASLLSGYQINFTFKKSGEKITSFNLGSD